jgi:regulatory protein
VTDISEKRAFDKALEALARRPRSTQELRRWLVQRAHAREDVGAAIDRLTGLGYLNDAEYARSFVRLRAGERALSRRRIRAELAGRGVAGELAEEAITEVMAEQGIDDRMLVEVAARKKMRALSALPPDVQRRRLLAYLVRNGHPLDLARETLATLMRRPL